MQKKKWSNILSNRFFISIIVFVLILTTLIFANVTRNILNNHAENVFYNETERIVDELEHSIMTYNEILNSQQAFFTADNPSKVNYEKWDRYIRNSKLFDLFPGIHVISFARYISGDHELDNYYFDIRNYYGKDHVIWPEGVRSEYLVNEFVGPSQHMEVGIGFDHFTEPIRNKAAIKAKETGIITATEKITLITDNGERGPGYIVYAPVYDHPNSNLLTTKEDREKYWYGHVLGAFYIEELIDSRISKKNEAEVEFVIYEVVKENDSPIEEKTLYESRVEGSNLLFPSNYKFSRVVPFSFAGVQWDIHFNSSPYLYSGFHSNLPLIILIAGGIISLLTYLFLRTTFQTREKAEELAKVMTEELSRIMNLQEAILNSSDYFIISVTTNGIIKTFNRGAEKLLGYSAEEVIDKHTPTLFHDPNHLEEISKKYNISFEDAVHKFNEEILKSGKKFEGELFYRRKDSTMVPIKLSVKPLKNTQGEIIGLLGMGHDITEMKKAQNQLQEKDKLLSSIIDTIPHPIFLKDLEGKYTLVNQATANLFYLTADELIGKTVYDVGIYSDEINQIEDDEHKVVELNKPIINTQSITHKKTGESSWFYVVKMPLITSDGMQILTIATDITERKWFEEELKSLRDKAIIASQAKSEFLAMMSHEIRTPMNAIIGIADLLDDTVLNEEQKEYVSIFRKSGENLLRIINDVLDLSKVEAGHITIEQKKIDLKNVVSDVISMFLYTVKNNNVELNWDYDTKLPVHVIGDQDRIRQIFSNLISNAVKYTDNGEINVKLELEDWIDKEQFILKCSIKDTGIGIPEDKISTVFDSFTQVDTSNTRRYGGTGLGLTIVRSFVEKMDGSINVESKVGVGSTFTFTILLKSATALIKDNKAESSQVQSNLEGQNKRNLTPDETISNRRLKVLLVEDSLDNQLLIKAYLKKENIDLELAYNGLEAVERFKERAFDIVLMDIQMPIMDGYTATKHIREWEKQQGLKETPILALTAHALKEDEMKSIRSGCNAHLTKPIKKNQLLDVLSSFTKQL